KKVAVLESQIDKNQKRFAENSQYTAWISFAPEQKALAQEVQNVLANVGFKASLTALSTERAEKKKGNSLYYWASEEAKAQEILALVKPMIKDVQSVKVPESGRPTKTTSVLPGILGGVTGFYLAGSGFYLELGS